MDNGYKSRKFILVLLAILIVPSLGILWALSNWASPILTIVVDSITTLVLGYCGILAARASLPVASSMVAKTITKQPTIPAPTPSTKEDLAGPKDLI
jgi:hypothetical protein